MRISVLGSGAWGTALAVAAAHRGHDVMLWSRRQEQAEQLASDRTHPALPTSRIPKEVQTIAELPLAVMRAELLILAVPSHAQRALATRLAKLRIKTPLVNVAKGLEMESGKRISQVLWEVTRSHDYAILSGPGFAPDVALSHPTAVVVASRDEDLAAKVQKALSGPEFRIYTSNDVVGVELGGALKNAMAIGAGVSDGLGFGDSSRAALITRALAEMTRIGQELGGKRETFFGLSGLGDLVLTCSSPKSRNHQVGERLGQGEKLEAILPTLSGVAEGVRSAKAFWSLARAKQLEAPIINEIYAMLYRKTAPEKALKNLMTRRLKAELD